MTREQITEIFIKAAEVDRKLPDNAKPAQLKAMNHGYVHDVADINGWDAEQKNEWRWGWLDQSKLRNSSNDMGLYEAAMELIKLVEDEGQRRALWAWSKMKAGGKPFASWCREEGEIRDGIRSSIHEETGRRRKDRAIALICCGLVRSGSQNEQNRQDGLLLAGGEISDISVNIAEERRTFSWREDAAFSPVAVPELRDFSWASKRNEMRRQREARRRAEQAA